MNAPRWAAGQLGFEAFGTACGLAVVTGALSVVAPTFDLLTLTLATLALAGWASLHRRATDRPRRLGPGAGAFAVPFAVLSAALVLFVAPPPPLAPWRALLVGLGVVPLWVTERHGHGPGRPPPGRPQ